MEALRGTQTAKSRWRRLRYLVQSAIREYPSPRKSISAAPAWSDSSTTEEASFPRLRDFFLPKVVNPLSSFSSSMMSPTSRLRILKHVIIATLRFQSTIGRGRRPMKRARNRRTATRLGEGPRPPVMKVFTSVQNLPDLNLKSIIQTDEISGNVYEVVHRQTGQTYALKEFPDDSSQRQQISGEIQILKELDHPNLVKCHDVVFGDAGVSFLLLEPLDSGSPSVTGESDLATLAYQLLLGLTYLHRKRISHGDIKPSNIFVDRAGQVKLLYLGKTLSKTRPLSVEIGAIHNGFSWDIWSVGLCILKLGKCLNWSDRVGDVEFSEDAASEQLQPLNLDLNLSDMDVDFNEPSSFREEEALLWKPSTELLRLLSACMQTDVLKRWRADQLVHHPFFDQLPPLKKEVQFPLKKEVQFPPVDLPPLKKLKNEVQLPLKKEVHLPPLKEEFRLPPLKKETQFSPSKKEVEPTLNEELEILLKKKREELMSNADKKPKIYVEDEDRVYDPESPKESTSGVPLAVPERCIEHCKLFLPDCEFEKDKLVRMWIAQDCIKVTKRMEDVGIKVIKRMEDIGNLYFDALVQKEVIVPSKFDRILRQMMYKFNTSQVSDELLKQGNYLRINPSNIDEICSEALHLTWKCKRLDRTFFDTLKNFKQLHTLVVQGDCCAVTGQLPNNIFLDLRLLRTLDLSHSDISEVPGSIGKLELLRYFDISWTPIKRLPESLDRLYGLQTLNLQACVGLSALPRGMGKLVDLRHLDLDIVSQLRSMPNGMGNLVKLQTLRAFIVGGNNDGCGIGELKNMNEITGSFCISRLENVSNTEEAKEAALFNKIYIDKLELRWNNCGNDDVQDSVEILESLQPHFHLKEIQISFYGGSKLPKWISNPSYTDLASITLYKCINCDMLPSIGELPSLKILTIFQMENVRNINTAFCRNNETKVVHAFPRLEKLTLENMPALEKWIGVEDGDFPSLRYVSIRYCSKLRVLSILSNLSSLEHLEISHCMQLITLTEGLLPGSLESLIIRGCPGISERCRKDGGLDWSKIASVRNIWIDLEKMSLD